MANFETDTKILKTLIKNTKKSGKEAWKAGKILLDIYCFSRYKLKYEKFSQYTKKEFGINEETAHKYMKISENIPFEKITENMLVSHLYTISEMGKGFREKVLDILALEGKANGNKDALSYDGEMLVIFKNMLEAAKTELSKEGCKEIFNAIKQLDGQEDERRKNVRKNPLEEGIELQKLQIHDKYKSIFKLYQLTPVSEQGLVGLFCTIFHLLQKEEFQYKNSIISFEQIIYIRTEFPDAQIAITDILNLSETYYNKGQDDCKSIDIEFELNSFNYWRHKHDESGERCHMIICWEVDRLPVELEIPPVLCLKEVLESGKIELIKSVKDYNKD